MIAFKSLETITDQFCPSFIQLCFRMVHLAGMMDFTQTILAMAEKWHLVSSAGST
jgi:hypothetical protein